MSNQHHLPAGVDLSDLRSFADFVKDPQRCSKEIMNNLLLCVAASETNYLAPCSLLLFRGADELTVDSELRTPLHLSVRRGNSDAALTKLLINNTKTKKSNSFQKFLNCQDQLGLSALHYACDQGRLAHTQLLLEAGAQVNLECYPPVVATNDVHQPIKQNPLEFVCPIHLAARRGHLDVLRLLVEHGAHIHKGYGSGAGKWKDPLYLAVESGSLACVQLLVEAGCDWVQSCVGRGPVELALEKGDVAIMKFFVSKGAVIPINRLVITAYTKQYAMLEYALSLTTEEMLRQKAQARDAMRLVVLSLIEKNDLRGLRTVLSAYPDLFSIMTSPRYLHSGAKHHAVDTVMYLLGLPDFADRAAEFSRFNTQGYTPLNLACVHKSHRVVRCFLQNGAGPNCIDRYRRTPLVCALMNGFRDEARTRWNEPHYCSLSLRRTLAELLRYGADLDQRSGFTVTPHQEDVEYAQPFEIATMTTQLYLLELLWLAGVSQRTAYTTLGAYEQRVIQCQDPSMASRAELTALLNSMASEPRRLTHICRAVVRGLLRSDVERRVCQLYRDQLIHEPLRDFLNLPEVEELDRKYPTTKFKDSAVFSSNEEYDGSDAEDNCSVHSCDSRSSRLSVLSSRMHRGDFGNAELVINMEDESEEEFTSEDESDVSDDDDGAVDDEDADDGDFVPPGAPAPPPADEYHESDDDSYVLSSEDDSSDDENDQQQQQQQQPHSGSEYSPVNSDDDLNMDDDDDEDDEEWVAQ